jgi:CHAT domain-containing protein
MIEATTPQSIGQSAVSVILSHGSQGIFGGFAGVNDFGVFTNEELARWLGESACVILFVCNAGRNDGRWFNQETFGIIGQLLRRGVRAVIAPPAPIRFDLPAIWFPPFYQELRSGKTVGQAYAVACNKVRQRFDHPCAWGALQLFGNAQLSFSSNNVNVQL